MDRDRCNCDASCGENRYHDRGDAGCVWAEIPTDLWHMNISDARLMILNEEWKSTNTKSTKTVEKKMPKTSNIGNKLSKVNESFTVNMYDNGFMVEVSGRDAKDDYKTSKVMVTTVDELIALIKEITVMERTD